MSLIKRLDFLSWGDWTIFERHSILCKCLYLDNTSLSQMERLDLRPDERVKVHMYWRHSLAWVEIDLSTRDIAFDHVCNWITHLYH